MRCLMFIEIISIYLDENEMLALNFKHPEHYKL